jgi:segregation and condensation protein A
MTSSVIVLDPFPELSMRRLSKVNSLRINSSKFYDTLQPIHYFNRKSQIFKIKLPFKFDQLHNRGIIYSRIETMMLLSNTETNYTIHTDVYEGPLDLLLDLITKAELDITRLSLAKVTDEYLTYLASMQQKSAVEVSGFLVIAAKLIQIKSEALLPRPPERLEGEEDPAESLARQLMIYKAIKQTSKWLQILEQIGQRNYIRLAAPPKIEESVDLSGIDIADLITMLQALFHFQEDAAPITTVVTIPRVTIKNKIKDLITYLRDQQSLSYRQLLPKDHDRVEAIVLFLAVLELIKQHYVDAVQEGLFADIQISATENTYMDQEITLALDT